MAIQVPRKISLLLWWVLLARKVRRVRLVKLVHKDLKENKVRRVNRDRRANKARRVKRVLLVPKDRKVNPGWAFRKPLPSTAPR